MTVLLGLALPIYISEVKQKKISDLAVTQHNVYLICPSAIRYSVHLSDTAARYPILEDSDCELPSAERKAKTMILSAVLGVGIE